MINKQKFKLIINQQLLSAMLKKLKEMAGKEQIATKTEHNIIKGYFNPQIINYFNHIKPQMKISSYLWSQKQIIKCAYGNCFL